MINFALPGMYEHHKILIYICALFRTHPEFFNDNININAVFGNFQFSAWDGGRIFQIESYKYASQETVLRLKEIYNQELQIPMRLIFTTALLDENVCHSYYDNFVTHLCEDDMNEIVVASPVLEKHLRNTYPKYSFISSTTKCLTNIDEAKKEIIDNNYKMVCIDYNLNKNKALLNAIPEDQKSKVEFLVNAICPPNCPSRKKHYKLNSLYNQSYGVPYQIGECGITKNNLYPLNYSNNLSFKEIQKYYEKGFSNFKIEGRTFDDVNLILTIVPYVIKPEYQMYIIEFLLHTFPDCDINKFSLERFKNFRL